MRSLLILIILFINIIFAQIVPFETSSIFSNTNDKINMLYIEDKSIGYNLDYRIEENSNIIFFKISKYLKQIFRQSLLIHTKYH